MEIKPESVNILGTAESQKCVVFCLFQAAGNTADEDEGEGEAHVTFRE